MTQWFNIHSLKSPHVCYIRYDKLVTEFQNETQNVLTFLGANSSESLHHFTITAKKLAARTPSHEKIEAGLSLGVQSSWQNFSRLFKRKEAEPLKKWLDLFGYSQELS